MRLHLVVEDITGRQLLLVRGDADIVIAALTSALARWASEWGMPRIRLDVE